MDSVCFLHDRVPSYNSIWLSPPWRVVDACVLDGVIWAVAYELDAECGEPLSGFSRSLPLSHSSLVMVQVKNKVCLMYVIIISNKPRLA